MTPNRKRSLGLALFAMTSSLLHAQTPPDQILKGYVSALDLLTQQLFLCRDADSAQRNAPSLTRRVTDVNTLLPQVKALYGNSTAQPALQQMAPALSDSQTRFAQEQGRVLTGNCTMEGKIKSVGGGKSISLTFVNRTGGPIQLSWIDYNGLRSGGGTAAAGGQFVAGSTYANHPWVASDSKGTCVALFVPTDPGTITVSDILAPTVGPYLTSLLK